MSEAITIRQLDRSEFQRVGEIDRTEQIDVVYKQHGTRLEQFHGDWSAQPWRQGEGAHSVGEQHEDLLRWADAGAITLGAFHGEQLVGIGVVVPHLRPRLAQLAYLYVSDGYRGTGIGGQLSDHLEQIAGDAGDSEVVVSATPSQNTVRFYLSRGFDPMAKPLPELFELEPEDIHLCKQLGS